MEGSSSVTEEGQLRMTVSKDVVRHLSSGLYRNFGRAVKELISNSYDAGATEVKIKLDLPNNRIIVRDNGRGMDLEELRDRFLSIGFPTPLSDKTDELGRKRIGIFGIGCLSVFPYCQTLQILTKKRNTSSNIELTINTAEFFRKDEFFLVEDVVVPYKLYPSDLRVEIGETILILKEIAPQIADDLKRKESQWKSSIDRFSGSQRFKWTISQYSPIQFPPNREDLKSFFAYDKRVPLRLWLDGDELFRNVPEGAEIIDKGEESFGKVSAKYALMTPLEPIQPEEARGFQVRLRDVAVGLPTDFDVIKLKGKVLGKLNWICGEIHIQSGLDSVLMIDRDSFYYTQEVAELQEFFRKKLLRWSNMLERMAIKDKGIYEALAGIRGSPRIIEELKDAGVIQISKSRLRLRKSPISKTKRGLVAPPAEKVAKALSKKTDFKVITKKNQAPEDTPPIDVLPDERSIIIYEEHPSFQEKMSMMGVEYQVDYDEWDTNEYPFSICRLHSQDKRVIFNMSHPLFKSKLSDEIIKKLSLGFGLIAQKRKDSRELLKQLNLLLEKIFLGD